MLIALKYYCVSLRYNAVCVPAAERGAPDTLRVSRPGQVRVTGRSSLQLVTLHTPPHVMPGDCKWSLSWSCNLGIVIQQPAIVWAPSCEPWH